MLKLFFSSKGIKDIRLHIFLCFCNQQNKCSFICITCLGQIFTGGTGESHPGQFKRTPAQRTFISFTIYMISFFQELPFQGNLLRHLRQQSVPARPLRCLDDRRRRPCRKCGWSSWCRGDQLVSNQIFPHHT